MDLYLDCEWADMFGADLVSLALVTADGASSFYAERDPLPDEPAPWAKTVVYPRLERGESAMPDPQFTEALRKFLASFDCPRICYDFNNDRVLLVQAIAGFGTGLADSPGLTQMDLEWQLLPDVKSALERWWREHPESSQERHNALMDAKALRAAWLSMWGV